MRVLVWFLPSDVVLAIGLVIATGALIWLGFLGPVSAAIWFFVRPVAVLVGSATNTAHDYVVRGWKAERRGDWAAALAEYDKAIELNPRDPEPHARRSALLAAHPELAKPG